MKTIMVLMAILLFVSIPVSAWEWNAHDFMVETYDAMHWSKAQEKFRRICPVPVGCVYLQEPGHGETEMREHFRLMKKLGFTNLKQIMSLPGTIPEDVLMIALEEGIIPWWYGEGGWEEITDDLLGKLGISTSLSNAEIREHPKMAAYQYSVLKNRIIEMKKARLEGRPTVGMAAVPDVGGIGPGLSEEARPLFVQWVKDHYQTVENVNFAWNMHHVGIAPDSRVFESWADFEDRWERLSNKEYRHLRDIFRFKADMRNEYIRQRLDGHMAFDPNAPFRAGGEMGMFLPFSYRGVDMEGIAELMTEYGSFYPSIHLAWHFDEVSHEIPRPHYMQAALTNDYFKGGWAASWESTGGPQQFSGGKGGNVFTVDDHTMTQLMLNYIAAGYKGFGLWCWNARTAGWEAGEYSLLDRHDQPTKRAVKAGQIGRAARKYRDELWQAHKEPLVGVYADWDNEAYWAAMSVQGREDFRNKPIHARVGVSRALINANVPYEYVTANDIRKGLAQRYPVIYMPFVISIAGDVMDMLADYVEGGGRLVMDMPSAYYDEYGKLMSTAPGTAFERVFGVTISSYQGAGVNRNYEINDFRLDGFTVQLTVTDADVLAAYDNGSPAVIESRFGDGSAVLLGYEASMMCAGPGNADAENMLLEYTLDGYESPYACDNAIVYRLAAPGADHYFFINDGPETNAVLDTKSFTYSGVTDAVTGERLSVGYPVSLEGNSGRWLRYEK